MASVPMPPTEGPRRVPPLGAFLEGCRRTIRAPAVVLGVATAVGLIAVLVDSATFGPMGFVIARSTSPIGAGSWTVGFQLFQVQLQQLSRVLAPEFTRLLYPQSLPLSLVAGLTIKAGLWMFLTGGAMDRLARGRPVRTAAFFAACGVYFFRFLRLSAMFGVPVWVLLIVQNAFAGNAPAQVVLLLVIAAVAVVMDFAKVRAVVEDRRSMLGAISAAVRFIRQRIWRVLALSMLNALAVLVVLRVDYQIATTPAGAWLSVLMFAGLVLLGVSARLAVLAAEITFFQGELAHAGYAAAPLPTWPDSPAVEAIENLVKRSAAQNRT